MSLFWFYISAFFLRKCKDNMWLNSEIQILVVRSNIVIKLNLYNVYFGAMVYFYAFTPTVRVSFPIWVGLPFTITKSKGQTHWGSRSILNAQEDITAHKEVLQLTIFIFYRFVGHYFDESEKSG
ncbi:hypothetical protein PHYBLDRAFT_70823 [Phycomyces blakesleeanus NRRL 1555(-)]|uniref:Uncharacterized protein n=1 Tax=Phycomyces blakesleeanus (strain ATCC 8743b / DSM 1359 / FGSC 10004 / NBRC 33097 / NRRL 1555) TaxID=763407 RepID=A0A167JNF4_PHYB8|nr:hypothetical protein PHYBLDRAFT_70823 [Phycomyces blakesleeanus NRRL 1555(-)]OAD66358.1 hypothetical protein PHYBLDRAFT_70823 [Phycomyces blakesleeanus NRRL 1555(-)]|eukprot:XP_018284398.1 hypothetical protein PHYBLDRAFT_70823 [Phycomyces blakesleeanus NRRL 1555(-)]